MRLSLADVVGGLVGIGEDIDRSGGGGGEGAWAM